MKIFHNKWVLLGILSLVWGSSFILIKQGISVFTPLQVGAYRMTVAGSVLVLFGLKNRKVIPRKSFKWILIAGFLGNFIPMFLFPFAQQRVSSSLAGILDSLVPIFIIILGFLFFKIKSSFTQVLGAFIGFLGAIVLIGIPNNDDSSNVGYSLLVILATILYALNGLILSRYLSKIPSFALSSVVFSIWLLPSILILLFSGFFHDFKGSPEQWKGIGYVTILGLVGTALAMILFYRLIQQTSAIFASIVTYLMPIVAVFWGILDGEKLSWLHGIGGILILLGVYLIQKKSTTK